MVPEDKGCVSKPEYESFIGGFSIENTNTQQATKLTQDLVNNIITAHFR